MHPAGAGRGGRITVLAAVTAVGLALLFSAPVFAAKRAAKVETEDLKELRGRIDRLKNDITSAEESRNEARDSLRESERAISEANRELRNLATERQEARTELNRLAAEARRVEGEMGSRQEAIGRLLTVRYLGGEADYLKLVVSGIDPNQTARDLHYYGYISRAQAEMIRSLRTTLDWLQELQTQTREKTAELAEIEADQKKERDQLAKEQSTRRRVMDKLSAQLRDQRREVKGLERDESRLARLVEALSRVIAEEARKRAKKPRSAATTAATPGRSNEKVPEYAVAESLGSTIGTAFAKLKGALRLPVRGELASRFGSPRPEGGPSWKGLFIRTQAGQEVRAVAAGRVVFADWMRGFGNLLILDHGQGYLTIYGNNEAVLKAVGETVRIGDPVATTGASGGSEESGLYFEMRHEGRAFDPLTWATLK
jgi:septal ring factor EnvC (AmiA/AmiB activator)